MTTSNELVMTMAKARLMHHRTEESASPTKSLPTSLAVVTKVLNTWPLRRTVMASYAAARVPTLSKLRNQASTLMQDIKENQ